MREDIRWMEAARRRSRKLLTTLISIIKRNVYKAFLEVVLLDDWRAVNENYRLQESRCTPYALGGFFIMDRTIRWWGEKHPHDSMTNFVFEEGDKNKGDFMWMMESVIRQDRSVLGIAKPRFEPKGLAPLQAADLAGWTMRRATRVWLTGEEERSIPRPVVEALIALQHVPHRAASL